MVRVAMLVILVSCGQDVDAVANHGLFRGDPENLGCFFPPHHVRIPESLPGDVEFVDELIGGVRASAPLTRRGDALAFGRVAGMGLASGVLTEDGAAWVLDVVVDYEGQDCTNHVRLVVLE